jgi:hypothetical protein
MYINKYYNFKMIVLVSWLYQHFITYIVKKVICKHEDESNVPQNNKNVSALYIMSPFFQNKSKKLWRTILYEQVMASKFSGSNFLELATEFDTSWFFWPQSSPWMSCPMFMLMDTGRFCLLRLRTTGSLPTVCKQRMILDICYGLWLIMIDTEIFWFQMISTISWLIKCMLSIWRLNLFFRNPIPAFHLRNFQ